MPKNLLWLAAVFPPPETEVLGGIWDTGYFHRTREAAIRDMEQYALKHGFLPIEWAAPDRQLTIGRMRRPGSDVEFVVMVRSGIVL